MECPHRLDVGRLARGCGVHPCQGREVLRVLVQHPGRTVSQGRDIFSGVWAAPGLTDRWLTALKSAGMPL